MKNKKNIGFFKNISGRVKSAYIGKRLLMVYIVSYLAVLVIPVLIGSLFYMETITTLEQSLIDTQQKAIVSTRQRIDQRFREVEAMVGQMSFNRNVIALQTATNPIEQGNTVVAFNIVQNSLLSMQATSGFVDSLMIYFKKSNAIMTTETVYLRLQDAYGKLINYADMDYESWQRQILLTPYNRQVLPPRQIRVGSFSKQYITYVQSFPINSTYNSVGNIIALIDEQRLFQLMDGLQLQDGGWASVQDAQDNLLFRYMPGGRNADVIAEIAIDPTQGSGFVERDVNGKSMMIFWDRSPVSGWLYSAAVSRDIVMSRVSQIKNLLLVVLGGIVFLGLMAAFALAYRNFIPLRDVIRLLSVQIGGKADSGERDGISNAVRQLVDRDKNLQSAVERQKPLLRAATLESLLHGRSTSEEKLMNTLQMLDLRIGPCGTVVVLRIEGFGEPDSSSLPHLNVASAVLREAIVLSLDECDYLIDNTLRDVVLILSLDSVEPHAMRKKVESVVQSITTHSNVGITAAVGNAVSRLMDFPDSYHQAQEVLEDSFSGKSSRIVWYSERIQDNHTYIYRPDTELQILNLVKGANQEDLQRILDGIYQENMKNRSLSPLILQVLLYDLCGTLVKLINQVPVNPQTLASIHEIAWKLGTHKTREEFTAIRNLLLQICQEQGTNRHSKQQNMIRAISGYIYANYDATWLGLASTAEQFGISVAYLSQLYKDQTGVNFSDDLEKYRMKKAKDLLLNKDLSIEDISTRTGYQSATAFRRAFKRVEGISPSEFRSEDHSIS